MGKLSFEGQRFSIIADELLQPTLIKEIKAAGFGYCADTFRWVTRSAVKAQALRRYADSSAENKLKKTFITELPAPECIPYPDHLQPKLFQIESAWHCLTRTPAYLADEAGLGKTITSILCLNAVPGKALVICPPFLKYNWVDEINKWAVWPSHWDRMSIYVVESGEPARSSFDADVVILPDSLIDSPCIQHYLKDLRFEWLFIDEAHRYKSPEAKRTVALIGSDKDEAELQKTYFHYTCVANRSVFLSGTPIPNGKPIELFPILNRVAPEAIGHRNQIEFGKRYCAGHQVTRMEGRRAIANWNFEGASNLKAFRRGLKEKLMVRHLKKDVMKELPPKTRKLVFLDSPTKLVKYERKLLKQYTLEELLGDDATLGDIARYQREVGEAKLPLALEYIIDHLENNPGKLIVGAHHITVVEGLHAGLKAYGALKIRGGMTAEVKSGLAKAFQEQPSYRVIVGNISSMGLGLTLTRAATAIVVEPSWVSGVNEQFEDRIHRITQAQNVYIKYLVLRGSLDERKLRSVLNKEQNINQVMG